MATKLLLVGVKRMSVYFAGKRFPTGYSLSQCSSTVQRRCLETLSSFIYSYIEYLLFNSCSNTHFTIIRGFFIKWLTYVHVQMSLEV